MQHVMLLYGRGGDSYLFLKNINRGENVIKSIKIKLYF